MVRGLYTAATGMTVQRGRMDVLTNNIVNADTVGFKADRLATSTFDEVMLKRINDPYVSIVGAEEVGGYAFGTHVEEVLTDFSPGALEETGRYTDLAIAGDGFFVVETQGGDVRYTRSGNFTVNSEGYLVTQGGAYVLGENGRVRVGTGQFSVSPTGEVTGPTAEQNRLLVAVFDDNGVLRKEGDNMYTVYGGAAPANTAGGNIRQGMLESSNVDLNSEMADMISVYRKYEASQKIVSMTDKSLGLTANLGKIGG